MWPSLVHGAQTKPPYIGLMVAPAVVLLLFAPRVIAPLHSLAAPPLLLAECPCTSPLRLNPALPPASHVATLPLCRTPRRTSLPPIATCGGGTAIRGMRLGRRSSPAGEAAVAAGALREVPVWGPGSVCLPVYHHTFLT